MHRLLTSSTYPSLGRTQAANLYVDPESSTSAVVDVETPDLEMFPKFEDAMKNCIQLVLRPGDMLFIPGMPPRVACSI